MRSFGAIIVLLAFILGGQLRAAENELPRMLILGDQIYQQPASDLQKELKGKVEVHYLRMEPGVVWNSKTALELLDRQLGDGRPLINVVHIAQQVFLFTHALFWRAGP